MRKKLLYVGGPSLEDIETTGVENFDGILCECLGCLVGGGKCFSEVKCRLVCSVELFRFYWNFIDEFKRGCSPVKLESLTDHLWTWHEFYYSRS